MTQNKKIAVTGGIGSGKSAVCEILREMGYPVFSADEEYAALLEEPDMLAALDRAFSVVSNGTLDRKKLAADVFSDAEKLKTLNRLTHPRVMRRLLDRMLAPLSFAEVPLLFEGGFESLFDGVFVVLRDREARIRALAARSGLSRAEAIARMKNQIDYEKTDFSAHTVIVNDGDYSALRRQVTLALESIR